MSPQRKRSLTLAMRNTRTMASELAWFSSCLRFVVLVEGDEGNGYYSDSVFAFRASGWDEAQARAVSIGRERETTYRNSDNRIVVWRLKEVRSLDQLGDDLADGREVFSRTEPLGPGETFRIDGDLALDDTRPSQSRV